MTSERSPPCCDVKETSTMLWRQRDLHHVVTSEKSSPVDEELTVADQKKRSGGSCFQLVLLTGVFWCWLQKGDPGFTYQVSKLGLSLEWGTERCWGKGYFIFYLESVEWAITFSLICVPNQISVALLLLYTDPQNNVSLWTRHLWKRWLWKLGHEERSRGPHELGMPVENY